MERPKWISPVGTIILKLKILQNHFLNLPNYPGWKSNLKLLILGTHVQALTSIGYFNAIFLLSLLTLHGCLAFACPWFCITAISLSSTCFSHTGLLSTSDTVGPHSLGAYRSLCPDLFSVIILWLLLIIQITQMSIPEKELFLTRGSNSPAYFHSFCLQSIPERFLFLCLFLSVSLSLG